MAPSYRKGRPLPWLAQVRDASGDVLTRSFATKEDALSYESSERRKRQLTRSGLARPQDAILFYDAVQKYLRKRFSSELAHSSVSQDAGRFKNYWVEKFGKRPVATITTSDILEHLDYIQFELNHAPADRNRHRALLHTFFEDLFLQEKIMANPVARIPLIAENKQRKKFGELKPENQEDYVRAMYSKGKDFGMLANLLCWTGGRIMACAAIQYRDVDFDLGAVHICRLIERSSGTAQERTKGGKEGGEEAVPLLPILREAILSHRASNEYTRPSDFIVNRPGGGWMPYEDYLHTHNDVITELGIPRFTPHAIRSFFSTAAKRAGFTRSERMEMLGHTSEAMTARYDRKDIAHLVSRAAKLGFGSNSVIHMSSKRGVRTGRGEKK